MEAHCVVGTLDWASLHAHHGYDAYPVFLNIEPFLRFMFGA